MIDLSLLISFIAGLFSVGTLLFGYFKLARSTELANVSSTVDLWKTRVELLEKELDDEKKRTDRQQAIINELRERTKECERRVSELLFENRELRKQ